MQDLWNRLEQFFAAQQWPVALRPGAIHSDEFYRRLFPLTVRRKSICTHFTSTFICDPS